MEVFDIYDEDGTFLVSGTEAGLQRLLARPIHKEAFDRVRREFDGHSPVILHGNGQYRTILAKPNVRG